MQDFNRPIDEIPGIEGWRNVPIKECGEPLVPVGPFSDHNMLFTDSVYWGERVSSPYNQGELNGACLTIFMRKGVADALSEVSKTLPRGYGLLIWDAYRPLEVQDALFQDYRDQLVDKKGMSIDQANEAATEFVSQPSDDPKHPSTHYSGASVDLTIVRFDADVLDELDQLNQKLQSDDWEVLYRAEMRRLQILRENATPLNMGVAFDEVCQEESFGGIQTNKTHTRYYEIKGQFVDLSEEETEIRDNRRMLFHGMSAQGFSNYWTEIWHFDRDNQFDAIRTGRQAKYGAITLSQANKDHEVMRVNHLRGSEYWRLLGQRVDKLGRAHKFSDPATQVVSDTAKNTGGMSVSKHPPAMRLTAA